MGNTFLFGRSVFSPSIYIAPLIVHTDQRLLQCEELLGRGKRERQTYRKTDRDRQRQIDRQRHREKERQTERQRQTDIYRQTKGRTHRHTRRNCQKDTQRNRERAIDRHRVTGTEEEPEEKTERDGERDRERQRHREGRFLFFVDSSNQQECRPSITGSEVVVKCTLQENRN